MGVAVLDRAELGSVRLVDRQCGIPERIGPLHQNVPPGGQVGVGTVTAVQAESSLYARMTAALASKQRRQAIAGDCLRRQLQMRVTLGYHTAVDRDLEDDRIALNAASLCVGDHPSILPRQVSGADHPAIHLADHHVR